MWSSTRHWVRRIVGSFKYRSVTHAEHLPPWMHRQVEEELAVFADSGITPALLDMAAKYYQQDYNSHFVRYRWDTRRLWYKADTRRFADYIAQRFRTITSVFAAVTSGLPDFECVVYLGDGFTGWAQRCPAPVFCFAKHNTLDRTALLLPDPDTLANGSTLSRRVAAGNAAHPWTSKLDLAFWRGATTGGPHTIENYQNHVRFKLVELARAHPEWIDAAFTEFHSCDPAVQEIVNRAGGLAEHVAIADHMRYRYLLIVDGFTAPWPRTFWGLHSNSVLIRQQSEILGWGDAATEPGVHFIPTQPDLRDLIDRLRWARNQTAAARQISRRARDFAAQNLRPEQVLGFVCRYLAAYAALYQKDG